MKPLIYQTLLVLVISLSLVFVSCAFNKHVNRTSGIRNGDDTNQPHQKYALLISISKYPKRSEWAELASFRDSYYMQLALFKQGFKKENIIVVDEKDATKNGIKAKFDELLVKLDSGAHVVIHYSGHGQQICDDNGDEVGDSLDETLVAYGAPKVTTCDEYNGDKHIRDDELGMWIDTIRRKVGTGGHVLVILDSCNSGTALKGTRASRGGPPILQKGKKPIMKPELSGFNEGLLIQASPSPRGNLVLFSAAAAHQPVTETNDKDTNPVGPLSYAFYKALNTISKENKNTYRSLFAEIQSLMAISSPNQTPSLEGDADYQIFGGDFIVQQAYFEIDQVKNDTILVKGGTLAGAAKGAEIGFYRSGIAKPNLQAWLATGEVVQAGPFSSKVILKQGQLPNPTADAWAFITKQSYNDWSVKVAVAPDIPAAIKQVLIDSLQRQAIVDVVPTEKAQVEFRPAKDGPALVLIRTADSTQMLELIQGGTSKAIVASALNRIKTYAITQFLKEFHLPPNNKYKVSIQVSAVDPNVSSQQRVSAGNVPQVVVGKPAWVTIKNEGEETFYYNILDFYPTGEVTVTVPVKDGPIPSELKLEKGKARTFKIDIEEPTGIELYRAFVGPKEFDLNLTFGFFKTKGPSSPIEELLHAAGKTKGTRLAFDPSAGGVANFAFEIVKEKP